MKNQPLILGLLSGLLYPHCLFAGGLFLYEIATPDAALSAAGLTARAQDASTAQSNPAGMTRLKGDHIMFGGQLMVSDINFNIGPQTSTVGNNGGNPIGLFPGISTFYVHTLTDDLRCGLAFYGNFGSALHYEDEWAGRYHTEKTVLLGLTVTPSLAYRITPLWSVGLGLNLMYGLFRTNTAINTPSQPGDGNCNMQDQDLAIGSQFSFLFEPNHCTRFGFVYNSPIKLQFKEIPEFSNLGSSLSTTLKNNGLLDSTLQINMTVPQTLMLSFFHDVNTRWAVLGSAGWQNWSQFGRVGIELDSINSTSLTVNREYQDTWHSSLGFQYKSAYAWNFSSGVAYDSSMVTNANRTADTPVGQTWRFGLGAQYPLSGCSKLNFAYTLNWIGNMPLDNEGGQLTGTLQGSYPRTALHFFGVSYERIL